MHDPRTPSRSADTTARRFLHLAGLPAAALIALTVAGNTNATAIGVAGLPANERSVHIPTPAQAQITLGVDVVIATVAAPAVPVGTPVPTTLVWSVLDEDGEFLDGRTTAEVGGDVVVRMPITTAGTYTLRASYSLADGTLGPRSETPFLIAGIQTSQTGPVIAAPTPAPPPAGTTSAHAPTPTPPPATAPRTVSAPAPILRFGAVRPLAGGRGVTIRVTTNRRMSFPVRTRRGATVLRARLVTVTAGTGTVRITAPRGATSIQLRHPLTKRWQTVRLPRR